MKKITIIGAGFSGLSLAYFLKQKGFDVKVIDKKSEAGGMISSPQHLNGLYETAANGFLNTARVETFLKSIQADYIGSSEQSKKRYIFKDKPRLWPLSILQTIFFILKLLFFIFKPRARRMARAHESVQAWSERNFGEAFTEFILAPALQGIYAGDISKLSACLVINQILNRKRKKKLSSSSLLSAVGGMGSLLKQLEQDLIRKDVQFEYQTSWTPKIRSDYLVIATSAFDAIPILQELNQEPAAKVLSKIEMLPLVSLTCFFDQVPARYNGFGILFPNAAPIKSLGVLMNNTIFKRDQQKHSETWIIGGALNKEAVLLSDEELVQQVQKDRDLTYGTHQKIESFVLTRWPRALPHYTIALEMNLNTLKLPKNIILHGNYLGHLGLSRILEKSEQLAEDLAKSGVL